MQGKVLVLWGENDTSDLNFVLKEVSINWKKLNMSYKIHKALL